MLRLSYVNDLRADNYLNVCVFCLIKNCSLMISRLSMFCTLLAVLQTPISRRHREETLSCASDPALDLELECGRGSTCRSVETFLVLVKATYFV